METGVYKTETFMEKDLYWSLKLWRNTEYESRAEEIIKSSAEKLGPLKPMRPEEKSGTEKKNKSGSEAVSVKVKYNPGFPSSITVDIRACYRVPGAGLMKLVGLGDRIVVHGSAQSSVYDSKDMINTTDYVMQLLRDTKAYGLFMEKTAPIRDTLNKIIGK
jgi:hypothetical protein